MEDATSVPTGPSTAPLQASGPTFFHDDVNDGLD
jgi:hypothetical protein